MLFSPGLNSVGAPEVVRTLRNTASLLALGAECVPPTLVKTPGPHSLLHLPPLLLLPSLPCSLSPHPPLLHVKKLLRLSGSLTRGKKCLRCAKWLSRRPPPAALTLCHGRDLLFAARRPARTPTASPPLMPHTLHHHAHHTAFPSPRAPVLRPPPHTCLVTLSFTLPGGEGPAGELPVWFILLFSIP